MTGNDIGGSLRKVLSKHGHGFQYAVLRRAEELERQGKSGWVLEATEFPIQVGGAVTHIDFVLRHRKSPILMVAECKRADPAKARWCFVKAPYTWRNSVQDEVRLDAIQYAPDSVIAHVHTQITEMGNYHLSVELKTHERGDGTASRSATEAATQVLRGMNGLINHLFVNSGKSFANDGRTIFLPVVFTTAEVWSSDVDLGNASLESGEIDAVQAEQREWIWFTHNQSAVLRHSVPRGDASESLTDSLRNEVARSIVVVGAGAIERFLTGAFPEWLV